METTLGTTPPILATAPGPSGHATPLTRAERDLATLDLTDRAATEAIVAANVADAPAWIESHRDALRGRMLERGWALVRGLPLGDARQFRDAITRLGMPIIEDYGDLPMRPTDDGTTGVFHVTRYPAKQAILFHCEGSHTPHAPRFIFFHCALPAEREGETPLVDCAAVFDALPPPMREAFESRGLLYRRNFLAGLDVSWQEYFRTDRRDEVERLCAHAGTRTRWHPDGSLETETFRPAVVRHPDTGAAVFFNQILLHHPCGLDPEVRAAIRNMHLQGRFPRNVMFGDGEIIPDDWVNEVLRVQSRLAVCFKWRAGDVVMVDNQRMAHARRPYSGARQHHVLLADAPAVEQARPPV